MSPCFQSFTILTFKNPSVQIHNLSLLGVKCAFENLAILDPLLENIPIHINFCMQFQELMNPKLKITYSRSSTLMGRPIMAKQKHPNCQMKLRQGWDELGLTYIQAIISSASLIGLLGLNTLP